MEAAPKVLVVDDDEPIRRMVALAFELEGFDVATASDGIEAIVQAESFHPDVMVLDIMMPRMDGLTVLGHLRKQPGTAGVRVLLLSAKADSTDITIGRRAGASDYVTKPFETDDLLERARAVMERPVPVVASVAAPAAPRYTAPLEMPEWVGDQDAAPPVWDRISRQAKEPQTRAVLALVLFAIVLVALVAYLIG